MMFRMLCSLRHVTGSCWEFARGSKMQFDSHAPVGFALRGRVVHVAVRRGPSTVRFQTQVAAAAKIRGQLFDWGKSRGAWKSSSPIFNSTRASGFWA